jgi:hypothetical protein
MPTSQKLRPYRVDYYLTHEAIQDEDGQWYAPEQSVIVRSTTIAKAKGEFALCSAGDNAKVLKVQRYYKKLRRAKTQKFVKVPTPKTPTQTPAIATTHESAPSITWISPPLPSGSSNMAIQTETGMDYILSIPPVTVSSHDPFNKCCEATSDPLAALAVEEPQAEPTTFMPDVQESPREIGIVTAVVVILILVLIAWLSRGA